MSDEIKPPEGDSVITKVEKELEKPDISMAHLEALEERLNTRLDTVTRDRTSDDTEKSELKAAIEDLKDQIKDLKETAAAHDKPRSDESTIVIPPAELDAPTHQNPTTPEATPENAPTTTKKKRMPWW